MWNQNELGPPQRTLFPEAPMRIAQVGWTGSTGDVHRNRIATDWNRDHPLSIGRDPSAVIEVRFDLTYDGLLSDRFGSDFLADVRTFDLVILHHLFTGWSPAEAEEAARWDHFCFGTSPLQSPDSWKQRLQATKATRVFAFGGRHEVAALYLGSIPDYSPTVTRFGIVYDYLRSRNPRRPTRGSRIINR
jgi:hypothetical protein